ncbi:uncharacterized protein LOC116846733 [Odontomachus brunneus]|uniref:uncharacterized protein LOC116846733 n=1 Tax=Odontomachus brunneus TaxID=486640 RepID=UPI0013F29162|nr:uncharacterized protein LOC116846733 [Odontomachus brunneus]
MEGLYCPHLSRVVDSLPLSRRNGPRWIAKENVSLKELGIDVLKNRRSITGALLLEVPGPDAKCRVRDLDDATTAADVVTAVAEYAGCDPTFVKAWPPFMPPRGLSTCRVRAPMAVIKKIVAAGRISVGWYQSRVELLTARPLTCFRCLEEGHTRSQCQSTVDCSGLCYRCGGVGHSAKECTGQVCCPVCFMGDR